MHPAWAEKPHAGKPRLWSNASRGTAPVSTQGAAMADLGSLGLSPPCLSPWAFCQTKLIVGPCKMVPVKWEERISAGKTPLWESCVLVSKVVHPCISCQAPLSSVCRYHGECKFSGRFCLVQTLRERLLGLRGPGMRGHNAFLRGTLWWLQRLAMLPEHQTLWLWVMPTTLCFSSNGRRYKGLQAGGAERQIWWGGRRMSSKDGSQSSFQWGDLFWTHLFAEPREGRVWSLTSKVPPD